MKNLWQFKCLSGNNGNLWELCIFVPNRIRKLILQSSRIAADSCLRSNFSNHLMTNPFEAIDLRLQSIENALAYLVKMVQHPVNQPVEDSIGAMEAARILNIPLKSLYSKTHQKLIPHSKPGKRLLFSRRALQDYIAANAVKTIQEELNEQHTLVKKRLSIHAKQGN